MHSISNLSSLIASARKVGVPLVSITTADPAATMQMVRSVSSDRTPSAPTVAWDAALGLQGLNDQGLQWLKGLNAAGTLQGSDALVVMSRLPENSLAFLLNAHRFLDQPDISQAVWNLRDLFKADGRLLVLLSPHLRLPPELSQDVLSLDEPLPGREELSEIVRTTYAHAELPEADERTVDKCAYACRGLSAFAAEQALALSVRVAGMDIPSLWARKRQAVEQTPGLSFSMGGPGFSSLGGLAHIKALGAGLFAGPQPPRIVVRIDEVEKQFAGSQGDLSGVAQDFSAVLLRAMQDYNWSGLIAVGPPGSGKSLFSKALGGEFQVPTLEIDLGACKGGILGESEANIRSVMRMVYALAGEGGAFWIATCNSITSLPPEIRRRFRYGAWMFDLPAREEREPIWEMYLEQFGLEERVRPWHRPEDDLWTGADIYNCCELAHRLQVGLEEASSHLLPVARSAPEQIRVLRELADGRFLSASFPGAYRKPDDAITPAPVTGRRLQVEP